MALNLNFKKTNEAIGQLMKLMMEKKMMDYQHAQTKDTLEQQLRGWIENQRVGSELEGQRMAEAQKYNLDLKEQEYLWKIMEDPEVDYLTKKIRYAQAKGDEMQATALSNLLDEKVKLGVAALGGVVKGEPDPEGLINLNSLYGNTYGGEMAVQGMQNMRQDKDLADKIKDRDLGWATLAVRRDELIQGGRKLQAEQLSKIADYLEGRVLKFEAVMDPDKVLAEEEQKKYEQQIAKEKAKETAGKALGGGLGGLKNLAVTAASTIWPGVNPLLADKYVEKEAPPTPPAPPPKHWAKGGEVDASGADIMTLVRSAKQARRLALAATKVGLTAQQLDLATELIDTGFMQAVGERAEKLLPNMLRANPAATREDALRVAEEQMSKELNIGLQPSQESKLASYVPQNDLVRVGADRLREVIDALTSINSYDPDKLRAYLYSRFPQEKAEIDRLLPLYGIKPLGAGPMRTSKVSPSNILGGGANPFL